MDRTIKRIEDALNRIAVMADKAAAAQAKAAADAEQYAQTRADVTLQMDELASLISELDSLEKRP